MPFSPHKLDLFPAIEPTSSGMLRVDNLHEIYWEISGNPKGTPVLFLHGGPGAGASPIQRRFFNPKHYKIIIFDQRGAGRSKPLAETQSNTTEHLIGDIETLRQFLGIKKWHIFGGSWGSTLALAYGQAHPDRCLSFILRGVCLLRKKEIDWFLYGMRNVFPEFWNYFVDIIPKEKRDDLLQAYQELFEGNDLVIKKEAMKRWLNYETSCSNFTPPEKPDLPIAADDHRLAMSVIEAHYFLNCRFIPDDKLLQNMSKIQHIPAHIVQGRYDMVCPLATAQELHEAWPESVLEVIPNAGHSALEEGIRHALVQATEKMKSIKK